MHTDKAIAEFEAWYIRHSAEAGITVTQEDMVRLRGTSGGYEAYPALSSKWIGWRAARAELVIDLPDAYADCPPYACYEGGWNDMRDEAVDRLEAAGVTVRG